MMSKGRANSKLLLFVTASVILFSYFANDVFAEEENSEIDSSISWNEGKIKWLETSYPSTGTGIVQIVDIDMNLNSEKIDNFDVDVWSDTDFAGIDLTLTETDVSSGIFEGTVFFTIADDSSGHRLRVNEGDTIFSKYDDPTIPKTNANDKLTFLSTATIQGDSVSMIEDRITLDKESYTWDDVVSIAIIAPEQNFDNKSIEKIDDPEKFPVKITTRHFEIDKYQLIETGVDTGVFSGKITLKSNEFLNTNYSDDDGVSVNFEYEEDKVSIASAPIIGNHEFSDLPSVSFDRDVYPVPFGSINDFEDTLSSLPDGRSLFPVHKKAIRGNSIDSSTTLGTGDLTIYIKINNTNFDVSPQEVNEISKDIDGNIVGPLKISVLRDSQIMVLAYAGGSTPNENGLIDVGDNNLENVRQLGPIYETAPDSGVFELAFVIRYTDGPSNPKCPTTAVFTSLNDDAVYGSEESRFGLPSIEKENYCIMNGDILIVEYASLDESGNVNVVTDSATFDLRNGILESDRPVYIIESDMILTLTDPDLDLDSDVAETRTLDLIEWDSYTAVLSLGELGGEVSAFDPEPSDFRETGDSTGIFQIVIEVPKSLGGDNLERGEEIVLEYTDWGPSGALYVGHEDEDSTLTIYASNFGATVELDQKVYTWTDKVYITIKAPGHNFDSDLPDEIGNNDKYPVKVATRQFNLDNYKLVETGTDTGIFAGEVTLVRIPHNGDIIPTGTGPTDGLLPSGSDDGVSISFEFSEDETVVGSALIISNQVQVNPLKQQMSGVLPKDVVCNDTLLKAYKYDGSAACVKPDTLSKIVKRGWFDNYSNSDVMVAANTQKTFRDTVKLDQFTIPDTLKESIRERVDNGTHQSIFVGVIDENGIDQYYYGNIAKDGNLIDENTIFETGSISKVFTSLILADMVENGEISLDDSIDKFLPENVQTPTWDEQKITLLDLATHTSGLPVMPNYPPNPDLDKEYDYDKEGLYEYLSDFELHREIGSQYEYSNTGGSLLGHILSLQAGKTYEQTLKERVLDKLGMDSTCIHQCDELRDRFAKPHGALGELVDEVGLDEDMAGAGGVKASGKDMLAFLSYAMGLQDSELKEAFDLTETPNHKINEILSIGLGWHIIERGDRNIVWQNGATEGFASFVGFDSDSKEGVIVLTNSQALVDEIGLELLEFSAEE